MKKNFAFLLFLFSISLGAQETLVDSLRNFYDSEKYDFIISNYAEKASTYPARAIYYIGMAYYMKEEDEKCIQFMDLSIEKDNQDFDPYYIKGMTYNYMNQFEEAISSFEKAALINPETSIPLIGMGDSYFSLKNYEKALESYQEACTKTDDTDRAYFMIPQVYANQNKIEKALEAFYTAKANISKENSSYVTVLYNIGLFELLNHEYERAKVVYEELLSLSPNDYETYSKMIQIFYGKQEYEKAQPYKDQLYTAFKEGLLTDHLEDMFCIDQFKWNNKSIRVFERYQEKPDEGKLLFNKHLFYILDENEEIESRIQTEYSEISLELGGPKYLLGMNKGKTHFTFSSLGFNDPIEYSKLKDAVIKVLNEEVKPTSSSYRN